MEKMAFFSIYNECYSFVHCLVEFLRTLYAWSCATKTYEPWLV